MRAALVIVGLLLFAPAAFASHADPLRGEWHLDAATPVGDDYSTPDTSGHGYSLLSADPPSIVAGRFSNAFQFGTDDRGLEGSFDPADTAELQPGTRFTLSAWAKYSGDPGLYKYIAAKGGDACIASSYTLYTGRNEGPGLQFVVYEDGVGTTFSPNAGTSMWDGQWHFLAGTYDGANVRLFVDGNEVGNGTPRADTSFDYGVTNHAFSIGRYPNAGCGQSSFPGAIDEVEVYSRPLTGSELRAMYLAGQTPVKPPPDRDNDGIEDTADNCPERSNPDQRDTDGNGIGQECEDVIPRIVVTGTRCVGNELTFDGSTSSPGRGREITNFAWELKEGYNDVPPTARGYWDLMGDGPGIYYSTLKNTFGWNIPPKPGKPYAQRGPAYIRLYVASDAPGPEVSTIRKITFLTKRSDRARPEACGRISSSAFSALQVGKLQAGADAKAVTVFSKCTSVIACVGSLVIKAVGGAPKTSARRATRTLARKSYAIGAGKRGKIRAKLTKRARRLLRKRRKLRVRATLTTYAPSGKPVKRSRVVKLKLRKRRH